MAPNKYQLKSIAGNMIVDNLGKFLYMEKSEKPYQDITLLPIEKINLALANLSKEQNFALFREKNIRYTKKDIKASSSPDILVTKVIAAIDDYEKIANMLVSRLRNWYVLYNPEFTLSFDNNEKFVELIITKDRKTLLMEVGSSEATTMGFDLEKKDIDEMKFHAVSVQQIYVQKKKLEIYLEKMMASLCPNLLEVAGATIGARLLGHSGTLKRLMEMPASKIQLLGAEKALFRHLVSGAKCPKHGLIFSHPVMSMTKPRNHGRAARSLADKISLAAKLDYFKGEFMGKKLRKQLEEKVQSLK